MCTDPFIEVFPTGSLRESKPLLLAAMIMHGVHPKSPYIASPCQLYAGLKPRLGRLQTANYNISRCNCTTAEVLVAHLIYADKHSRYLLSIFISSVSSVTLPNSRFEVDGGLFVFAIAFRVSNLS